jgi:hypothetical protein
MDIEDVNRTLERAYKVESVLDTLLDFEDVLEKTNIYAYDHWGAGEIALGPDIDKYWITVTLMYPYRLMPDPAGAERLLKYNCKVQYKEDTFVQPGTIRTPDDVDYDDPETDIQRGKYKAKPTKKRVWLVTIEMPRDLIATQSVEKVQFADDDVDLEDVQKAEDENLDSEEAFTNADK